MCLVHAQTHTRIPKELTFMRCTIFCYHLLSPSTWTRTRLMCVYRSFPTYSGPLLRLLQSLYLCLYSKFIDACCHLLRLPLNSRKAHVYGLLLGASYKYINTKSISTPYKYIYIYILFGTSSREFEYIHRNISTPYKYELGGRSSGGAWWSE